MKRHWRWIVAVLVLVIMAEVASWWLSGPKEPGYRGKRLSEWMPECPRALVTTIFDIENGTKSTNNAVMLPPTTKKPVPSLYGAQTAIEIIGTNSIPYLKSMLLTRDSSLRSRLDPWIQKVPWLEEKISFPRDRRERAMMAVLWLRKDAVPLMIEVFNDANAPVDVRRFAAWTFTQFPGESREALATLKQTQKHSDSILADFSTQAVQAIER
jgi:hypothetical protein